MVFCKYLLYEVRDEDLQANKNHVPLIINILKHSKLSQEITMVDPEGFKVSIETPF